MLEALLSDPIWCIIIQSGSYSTKSTTSWFDREMSALNNLLNAGKITIEQYYDSIIKYETLNLKNLLANT